jgi:hypothetical protein
MASFQEKINALPSTSLFTREERMILREFPQEYRTKKNWFKTYTLQEKVDAIAMICANVTGNGNVCSIMNIDRAFYHEFDFLLKMQDKAEKNLEKLCLFYCALYLVQKFIMDIRISDAEKLKLIITTVTKLKEHETKFGFSPVEFFSYETVNFPDFSSFEEIAVKTATRTKKN